MRKQKEDNLSIVLSSNLNTDYNYVQGKAWWEHMEDISGNAGLLLQYVVLLCRLARQLDDW